MIKPPKGPEYSALIIAAMILLTGCGSPFEGQSVFMDRAPLIEPDYYGVTIPYNIAPLNFRLMEDAEAFYLALTSPAGPDLKLRTRDGIVAFPERRWKKVLYENRGEAIEISIVSLSEDGELSRYKPIRIHVAEEPIDPYLCYRLFYPGYETWNEIKIIQRNLTNFQEISVVENQLLEKNCVNCHSFSQNSPERFLLHVRGSAGGTYFMRDGQLTRTDLKTEEMNSGAVYPAWHPDGRFVIFSSNDVIQSFHAIAEENIEVFDLASSLVLYDTENNEMMPVPETDSMAVMATFPEWSPGGDFVYYCQAPQFVEGSDFRTIKYDLVRKAFNRETRTFGETEPVFDARALDKSVSFPRISPDGRHLVFTLHDYGTFSIWHREADLYILDLETGIHDLMSVNSSESESYHTWSSNSKWLVFSSKRGDGLTARPYFAYMGSSQQSVKPFVLPQKDPELYLRMLETFNKPELVTGKIDAGPRDFDRASKNQALKARWVEVDPGP